MMTRLIMLVSRPPIGGYGEMERWEDRGGAESTEAKKCLRKRIISLYNCMRKSKQLNKAHCILFYEEMTTENTNLRYEQDRTF